MQGTSQTADLLHPTADERREVAARLRETNLTEYAEEVERSEGLSKVAAARFVAIPNLVGALNFDKPIVSAKELTDRLADLIEPEPERTCQIVQNRCTNCDHEINDRSYFEKVTLDDGCWTAESRTANYCPNCGAKVVE